MSTFCSLGQVTSRCNGSSAASAAWAALSTLTLALSLSSASSRWVSAVSTEPKPPATRGNVAPERPKTPLIS
eukprot:scaffold7346_cov245-Pinguiococcus_pyrenoidosus.AAC.29